MKHRWQQLGRQIIIWQTLVNCPQSRRNVLFLQLHVKMCAGVKTYLLSICFVCIAFGEEKHISDMIVITINNYEFSSVL